MAPAALSSPVSTIKAGHVDVQEVSKTQPTTVPERFIRGVAERPTEVIAITSSTTTIPVIDVSKLVSCSNQESQIEMEKLAFACEEWGFFQVVNHGIELSLLESMVKLGMEFFMLPLEEKEKYPMIPGTVQGYGQAFVFSEDQKLDWINMMALAIVPSSIRMPHLWPTKPPRFGETLDLYSMELRKLCHGLLGFMAQNLGLKRDAFDEIFGYAFQSMRMNYYPPCSRPDLVLGLSPHSDGSALTVLQQRQGDTFPGLQILKNNTWIPISPIPNALVINLGDTMEVVTNGKYKSVVHRAVTDKDKDRMSIISFYAPSFEVELGPMPEFIEKDKPTIFRRYNHGEYARHYLTNKLEGKKILEFCKIQM